MLHTEQLLKWLENVSEKVQRNVQVVTDEDINQSFLLHISTNTNLRKFIPVIGRRQASSEDRTVPRVCVCPTLLGCMIGYAKIEADFHNNIPDGSKDNEGYKGGWKIYAFPFLASLRPNKKLVFDADRSDEHWLTSYSPDTAEYIPETAGKFFFRSIQMVARNNKLPYGEMDAFLEITRDSGIHFSPRHYLEKGYYRITGPLPQNVSDWNDDAEYRVSTLTRDEYLAVKRSCADMLSLPANPPEFLNW